MTGLGGSMVRSHGWHLLAVVLSCAVAVGLIAGQQIAMPTPAHSLVIGNTAGTLSVVAQLGDVRVVVGGGSSRSDLVELVGRTAPPWRQRVDLLIVPAGDTRQITGAMQLIQDGDVRQLAVLGVAGAESIWTGLERVAAERGVVVRHVPGSAGVMLPSGDVDVQLVVADHDASGESISVVILSYRGAVITIVDGPPRAVEALNEAGKLPSDPDVVIAQRDGEGGALRGAAVVVRPEPARSIPASQVDGAAFTSELSRGERLIVTLDGDELRLPLDQMTPAASPPAGAR